MKNIFIFHRKRKERDIRDMTNIWQVSQNKGAIDTGEINFSFHYLFNLLLMQTEHPSVQLAKDGVAFIVKKPQEKQRIHHCG